MKITKQACIELGILAGIGLVALLIPQVFHSRYVISLGINICVMAAFGSAWNILGGYAGQIGFAHAAFFSIGAYSAVIPYVYFRLTPWVGMLIGLCISLLAALLIGTITLRFKGPYFMLCTIAFIKCIETVLIWQKDITKGLSGLVIPIKGNHFETLIFKDTIYYYYILIVLMMLSFIISWAVSHSKAGFCMRAIKADENAAESLGIESKNYKVMAFLISSAIVSILGSVYAFYLAYIDPTAVGGTELAIRILSYVVVGGIGNLFGPFLGAALLVPAVDFANTVGPNGSGTLIYGLALIIIMRFRPKGLISFILDDYGHLRRFGKKKAKQVEEVNHE